MDEKHDPIEKSRKGKSQMSESEEELSLEGLEEEPEMEILTEAILEKDVDRGGSKDSTTEDDPEDLEEMEEPGETAVQEDLLESAEPGEVGMELKGDLADEDLLPEYHLVPHTFELADLDPARDPPKPPLEDPPEEPQGEDVEGPQHEVLEKAALPLPEDAPEGVRDPVADPVGRRVSMAREMAVAGEHEAALDLLESALS